MNSKKSAELDVSNKQQIYEIGDIGWFTYDEVIKLLRPYHLERRKLLNELLLFINNIIIDNNDKIYDSL